MLNQLVPPNVFFTDQLECSDAPKLLFIKFGAHGMSKFMLSACQTLNLSILCY